MINIKKPDLCKSNYSYVVIKTYFFYIESPAGLFIYSIIDLKTGHNEYYYIKGHI